MKDRGTYLLLAVFFTGLVGLWVADFVRLPTRLERDRMSSRILYELLETKPDDLQKIELLVSPETIVFERQKTGNRWQMTSPLNVAADPSKVETLALNLKELSRKPEAATLEGNPSQFGLAPPEGVIRLWGTATDSPLATLELGKTILDRRYVRRAGSDGAEVVDARGLDLVKLAPINWRDRELFRVPSLEVDAITLSGGGKELKVRRGRDAWRIVEPFPVLADETKMEGLIADLGTLRVMDDSRFVANDVTDSGLDRYGLKTPALTIEIDAGRMNRPREPQILHVGKPVEGKEGLVYARRGDQNDVIAIETRVLKTIKPNPNLYRSAKVADINPARVIRIGFEDAKGTEFELIRSGPNWTLVKPSVAQADRKVIEGFLKSLEQLQTNNYPTAEAVPDPGLSKPTLVLKIWQARDPRGSSGSGSTESPEELALTLKVGKRDAGRKSIYGQLAGDSTVLALPDSANDFLPRNSLSFRDRLVLGESDEQIERIKFVGESRKFTLNAPALKLDPFGNGPLGWWMVEPVDAPADATSVSQLLRLLSNLRAESLVAENADDLQTYGLKSPALTLTWSKLPQISLLRSAPGTNSSPGTITLEDRSLIVGAAVPGRLNSRYAKISNRPLIFTVGADILGILDQEWRDHSVVSFNPDRVRKVRLDWMDRGLTVDASGSGGSRTWSLASPSNEPNFDPQRVEALIQSCSGLTTTRYVQHQGEFPSNRGLTPPTLAIRFDLDDGSRPRTLKLGASAPKGQLFATTETESNGPIFLVPDTTFSTWLKPPRRPDDLPDDVFAP